MQATNISILLKKVTVTLDEAVQKYSGVGEWFLPSLDELQAMYDVLHLSGLGGFSNENYWASYEFNSVNSYYIDFSDGTNGDDGKGSQYYVRACRSFTGTTLDYPLRSLGPAGGYVFAHDNGLVYECAPSDQSTSQSWSNITGVAIGTTGTAIGTGKQNTADIIAQSGHTASAAKVCDDYAGMVLTELTCQYLKNILASKRVQDSSANEADNFTVNVDLSNLVSPPVISNFTLFDIVNTDNIIGNSDIVLDDSKVPDFTDFIITLSGGAINVVAITITDLVESLQNKDLILALDRYVQYGETGTIQYTPNSDPAKKLQGLDNNWALAFTENVTNNAIAPPVITSVEVGTYGANKWRVVTNLALADTMPAPSCFAVSGITYNAIEKVGTNEVELTSDQNASYGVDYGNLAYTKPSSNWLQGVNNNYVVTQSIAVTNNVLPLTPDVPTGLTAVWVNDFCRLTVNDISADVQIEWYESKNGGVYSLVTTTSLDVVTTDNYTWQNESMAFKCRAKKGSDYSDYCTPVSLTTPLVWKAVLAAAATLSIQALSITAGKTVNVNWGDGTNNDYTGAGARSRAYAGAGTYYVLMTGDVNFITNITAYTQTRWQQSLAKWVLPTALTVLYLEGIGITNFATMQIPVTLAGTVTIDYNSSLTGATPNLVNSTSNVGYLFNNNKLSSCGTTIFSRKLIAFNIGVQGVSFPTAQIDILLANINTWFTANSPLVNCTYTMNGANNGSPTGGVNNTDLLAVKAIYVAAGKVATFVIS